MRIWLAIRVFFLVLFQGDTARKVAALLDNSPMAAPKTAPASAVEPAAAAPVSKPAPAPPTKPKPVRSEALTLLATLQRESRLVDFLQERLDGYDDAQIGAAVRDVQRDAAKTLDRLFGLQPLCAEGEGAALEIPSGFDPGKFQLTGNVSGQPPYQGQLVHHGWQAVRCELPTWTGSESAAMVIAPTEVELR